MPEISEERGEPAGRPGMPRRLRIGLAVAGGAVLLAGAGGWALVGGGSDHPATPATEPSTSAPVTPSPSVSPSQEPSPSPSPSESPSAEAVADPSTPASALTGPRPTKKPVTQISPGHDCNCDNHTPTRNPTCAYDPSGRLMTCDPVITPTPLPNPRVSQSPFNPGTVPPGGHL